jgi:hypothetical protein
VIDPSTFDSQTGATLIERIYERVLREGPGIKQPLLDELVEKIVDEETDREIENKVPTVRGRMLARYLMPQGYCDALCQEIKQAISGYQFKEALRRLASRPN